MNPGPERPDPHRDVIDTGAAQGRTGPDALDPPVQLANPAAPEDSSLTPLVHVQPRDPQTVRPAFLVVRGPSRGRVFAVPAGELMLGRAPTVDLTIDAKCLSRRHLKILCTPQMSVSIADQGSRNGTRVNGERVTTCKLLEGDRIELGNEVELLFTTTDAAPQSATDNRNQPTPLAKSLSPRQYEVAAMAVKGMSKPKIAAALGVSLSTVATHIENIYKKMGIHSRVDLVRRWYDEHGQG